MIRKIIDIFKSKELREKILFTLGILLVYKFGVTLIVPGVDPSTLNPFGEGDLFGLMDVMGGNALSKFSLFALGVSPYITSSIVIQLLTMTNLLPKLSDLSKQGEKGRKKLDTTTRYLTLLLAAVNGFTAIKLMEQYGLTPVGGGSFTVYNYIYIMVVLMAGSMFLMWLADRITAKGVGNGMSMMIAAGIVSTIPNQFVTAYRNFVTFVGNNSNIVTGLLQYGGYILAYLVFIVFVVFIEKSVRKIPLQHSQNTSSPSDIQHFPIKLNPAGVIPVIFASSFMMLIATLPNIFKATGRFAMSVSQIFNMGAKFNGVYWGLIIYVFLIMFFTIFWSKMQLDSEKISEDLALRNSYIPGIRQGKETERYLSKIINRISFVGGLSLAFIAALPIVLSIVLDISNSIAIGGTSFIIVVGVAIETYEQINSKLAGKEYKGFS